MQGLYLCGWSAVVSVFSQILFIWWVTLLWCSHKQVMDRAVSTDYSYHRRYTNTSLKPFCSLLWMFHFVPLYYRCFLCIYQSNSSWKYWKYILVNLKTFLKTIFSSVLPEPCKSSLFLLFIYLLLLFRIVEMKMKRWNQQYIIYIKD